MCTTTFPAAAAAAAGRDDHTQEDADDHDDDDVQKMTMMMISRTESNNGKSKRRRRQQQQNERGCVALISNWTRWLFQAKNPVVTGILLYLVLFQMTMMYYNHHHSSKNNDRDDYEASDSPITTTSSVARSTKAIMMSNQFLSPGCKDDQQQQPQLQLSSVARQVGVFPRHDPVPPPPEKTAVAWKPYSDVQQKLPYPIFVTSMPKSGTTSIWKYFKCGEQLGAHNWIQKPGEKKSTLLGICIENNIHAGLPPFQDCGDYDVYTDTGYINYDHDTGEKCFYPSIDALEEIYTSYPTATFVNVIRDTEAWYESLKSWSHSSLFIRFRLCNATGLPNGQSTKEEFMHFYDAHNEYIRQFVRDRPSLTYVEVKLEAPETGRILSEATGIEASCWKQCKPQQRKCEEDYASEEEKKKEAVAKEQRKKRREQKEKDNNNKKKKPTPKGS